MWNREPNCLADAAEDARELHALRPNGLARFLETRTPAEAGFLIDSGFKAEEGEIRLLPATNGAVQMVFGLGQPPTPRIFGKLPFELPEKSIWMLQAGDYDPEQALLGFCLGAYRFDRFKPLPRAPARLVPPPGMEAVLQAVRSVWLVRDLVNTPANCLGPAELADAVRQIAGRYGATFSRIDGPALEKEYPAIAAVGAGSDRPPVVARFQWQGSHATTESPLVAICGKGVCFDTGGYDLKTSASMLRMKKDMGGAAISMGLAQMIMAADWPIRLTMSIGCVENSVSGHAMRPSDVIPTRRGLHVEIGNTDCEGRLVLADLLAEASDSGPDMLIDFATLTGAARTALGPDMPALFCHDDRWAAQWMIAGAEAEDPVWRLPLWPGYESWLKSSVADVNNMASKPMAGAITAALFLQRFVRPGTPWAHLDTYAWNDGNRPGYPEGGEAQGMRAAFKAIFLGLQEKLDKQNKT